MEKKDLNVVVERLSDDSEAADWLPLHLVLDERLQGEVQEVVPKHEETNTGRIFRRHRSCSRISSHLYGDPPV